MLPGLSTYRIDIQQGNVVTQDMVAKLKPGMTRQQVRFVMGTPPIVDAFRQDRWDYVYYFNRGGKVAEHRRLILLFDGDVLKRVEGDVVAGSEQAATAGPAGTATSSGAKPEVKAAEKPGTSPEAEKTAPPAP